MILPTGATVAVADGETVRLFHNTGVKPRGAFGRDHGARACDDQTISSVNGFFDNKKHNFNPFVASGSLGMCIDEVNGDNFDPGPLGFVRGSHVG